MLMHTTEDKTRTSGHARTHRGPLTGVTVLDLTRVMSGPYCTMLLADMGARVIKIEHPCNGDDTRQWGPPFQEGESAYFLSINRNKQSVALDFKHPAGRLVLDRLIARSDVLVENFRPHKLAKMGLDYQTLAAEHRRLIYCSISGFGQTGRRSAEPGYDAVMQAEGGLMSISGTTDGPPIRPGVPIADITSGMFAAYGIALALFNRERTGVGQEVDVGMLDTVVTLLTYQAATFFATGTVPSRLGNRHAIVAPYETLTASDGEFVLAVGNDEQWRRCCAVIGLDALAEDKRFETNQARLSRYDELKAILSERFVTQTRQYWLERLAAAGVPSGSVRNIQEVFAEPQLRDREMLVDVQHSIAGLLTLVGVPVKLSGTPGSIQTAPPMLGEHTEEILRCDLGLSDDQITNLREQGVVSCGNLAARSEPEDGAPLRALA
jgi:crotonobetainyl-CoA:carnitine CoA-transferase CaiB-like acyl-CoA transferase